MGEIGDKESKRDLYEAMREERECPNHLERLTPLPFKMIIESTPTNFNPSDHPYFRNRSGGPGKTYK